MRKQRIGVDLDDVLNCLVETWLDRYNGVYGDDVMVADIKSWDIAGHTQRCTKRQLYELLHGIYQRVPVAAGAEEAMRLLASVGDVYIVSAYGGDGLLLPEKLDWVRRNLPRGTYQDVVFMTEKALFGGDILIDDKPDNLMGFCAGSRGRTGYLVARPWNHKNATGLYRFNGVLDAARRVYERTLSWVD